MTCCGRVEPPKVTRSWKYGFMRIIEERPDGWSFVGSRNRPPLRLWCGSCTEALRSPLVRGCESHQESTARTGTALVHVGQGRRFAGKSAP